jgi:hypothetical protein
VSGRPAVGDAGEGKSTVCPMTTESNWLDVSSSWIAATLSPK